MIKYVDLDGTLAKEDPWRGPMIIGEPIEAMVKKVKQWLSQGDSVTIFKARITESEFYGVPKDNSEVVKNIQKWCLEHIGVELPVTNIKGHFNRLYDDRATGMG